MEHAVPRAAPRLDQSSQNTAMPTPMRVVFSEFYRAPGIRAQAFLLTGHCWCVGDTEGKQEAVALGAVVIWKIHSPC